MLFHAFGLQGAGHVSERLLSDLRGLVRVNAMLVELLFAKVFHKKLSPLLMKPAQKLQDCLSLRDHISTRSRLLARLHLFGQHLIIRGVRTRCVDRLRGRQERLGLRLLGVLGLLLAPRAPKLSQLPTFIRHLGVQ